MNDRLVNPPTPTRRRIRVMSRPSRLFLPLLLLIVLAVIATPRFVGRHGHRVRLLLPNGDVFSRAQISEMPASYFVENFTDDPSAFLESGSGVVEIEIEELHTCTRTSPVLPTRRHDYSLMVSWQIMIEDGEVKHIDKSMPRKKGDESPNNLLHQTD